MFSKSREAPLSDSKIKLASYYLKAAYYMESKQNISRRDFLIFLRFDTRQDRGKYHSRKYKKSTVTEY